MPSSPTTAPGPGDAGPAARLQQCRARYWRANVRITMALLLVWAVAGLGCGVLWADWLDQWHLSGFPLGFWFAQQGSIVVFVLLILVYALLMARLDRRHHRELEALQPGPDGGDAP